MINFIKESVELVNKRCAISDKYHESNVKSLRDYVSELENRIERLEKGSKYKNPLI